MDENSSYMSQSPILFIGKITNNPIATIDNFGK